MNRLARVIIKLEIDCYVLPIPNLNEVNKKNTYLQRTPKK